jgi:iron complex outermembrane receptor protein
MNRAHSVNAVGRTIAAVLGVSFLPLSAAIAQEPPQEVVITGSRIARPSDFESPSPVITVDHEAIEKSGYSNLQQLFDRVPANGNGAFSTRGNNQDSTANGAASISLRGLGADATLVLVNGRRVAISPFAESVTTSFVDINAIPVGAIERVEVLKDGSSAVYGSDAVAGVVNIILRKDFTGFESSVGYGQVTSGPYDETTASAIWGTGSDNSNVTLIFDYFKNSTLGNADRGSLGSADQAARGGEDFRSSRGYPGRFDVTQGGKTTTLRDPRCPPAQVAGQTCVYDFGPWNLLIPEAERSGLMLLGHQDVGANAKVFTEIAVQHNRSMSQGAPTPLDETALMTVPTTNPGNPFPGATAISIGRYRTVDAGPRIWHIQSDNLRGVIGLEGKFGNENAWSYEIAAQRARSESDQTGNRGDGWIRTDFLQQQINAGLYNPFGATQNPQSVIDAISTNLVRRGKSQLTLYSAGLSGELFELPAAAVRMATGVEYRKEGVSDVPDDQFQRGLIFGTEAVSAEASRNIYAAYVEFSVPILKSLELSLAGRYDHYNDFGSTTNPKVALRWSPLDSLAFRTSWGTGFRAPSLAQIGLGPSQSSQFFTDTFGCAVNPTFCTATDYNLVFSGNPNLQPEKSHSFNAGVAFKPRSDLELTLDYWDIQQNHKIDQVPLGFLYSNNCATQASTVCIRGTPLPGQTLGPLQTIAATFVNIGQQSASGLDLGGFIGLDAGPGRLTLGLQYSHLLKFERVELNTAGTDFVRRSLDGEYEYPEDRAVLSADWSREAFGVYANLNYVGPFEDTPDFDFDGTLDYDTHKSREVGSFTTLNLQFRYTGIKNTRLMLGVDNAFDQKPPFAIGDGNDDLYGYVQSQHNPRGRFWNFKALFNF